jgi:hypothetical protein
VYIYEMEIYIGPLKIGPCLGPALWAEVAAQALSTYRAVPALSTIGRASGRASIVLFSVVSRAANRARTIWNTIVKRNPDAASFIFVLVHPPWLQATDKTN